jgi:uncharacterized cupredoxin-like copper-binding protein
MCRIRVAALVLALASASTFLAGPSTVARAHEGHDHEGFSAGEPGNTKQAARTIKVKMYKDGKKMLFEPAQIELRKGEQIRFLLQNEDDEKHEFVLATPAENRKHAELMKKYPDMEHEDPNGKTVPSYGSGDLLWKFTKPGSFEFACLISGHYEKGMFGTIVVK